MQYRAVYNDADYAIAFQKGEEAGFTHFFRSFYPSLTLLAFKITGDTQVSEELASEAFIKIWRHHKRFYTTESIRAYLYQIVRNDSLKWIKKAQRQQQLSKEAAYMLTSFEEDHFRFLVDAETSRQLQSYIGQLPSQCCQVFEMLYIEGKSVRETADELNLSVSTVKTQKARGLAILKQKISLLISFTLLFVVFSKL